MSNDMSMRPEQIGEYRVIGQRTDGWWVIITVEVIDNENTFEIKSLPKGKVRSHDAEAWRKERHDNG